MKYIYLFVLGLFFLSFQSDETEYESALIPTKTGAIFAFTSNRNSFTLELNSDSIEPLEAKNFVIVDNWIFQAFTIGFDNPKNVDLSLESVQKKSLSQYVMYELDYFKKELKIPCDSLKLNWVDINEHYFYFWYFNTPDSMVTVQKQIYLTTICHNQILNMNIPLDKGKKFKDGKDFLFKVAGTLDIKNEPIDFDKLYEELNK